MREVDRRAANNSMEAHHFPIDVVPSQRQRFRGCPKPTVATRHHLLPTLNRGRFVTLAAAFHVGRDVRLIYTR
jgi:hypothetical protein